MAEKSGLTLNEKEKHQLATITAFNINAKYDDYKMSFNKRCTPDFTEDWINKLKALRTWLHKLVEQ